MKTLQCGPAAVVDVAAALPALAQNNTLGGALLAAQQAQSLAARQPAGPGGAVVGVIGAAALGSQMARVRAITGTTIVAGCVIATANIARSTVATAIELADRCGGDRRRAGLGLSDCPPAGEFLRPCRLFFSPLAECS